MSNENLEDRQSGVQDALGYAESIRDRFEGIKSKLDDLDLLGLFTKAEEIVDAFGCAESCETATDFEGNLKVAREVTATLKADLKAARTKAKAEGADDVVEEIEEARESLKWIVKELADL